MIDECMDSCFTKFSISITSLGKSTASDKTLKKSTVLKNEIFVAAVKIQHIKALDSFGTLTLYGVIAGAEHGHVVSVSVGYDQLMVSLWDA